MARPPRRARLALVRLGIGLRLSFACGLALLGFFLAPLELLLFPVLLDTSPLRTFLAIIRFLQLTILKYGKGTLGLRSGRR